jgi:hypothetical protein
MFYGFAVVDNHRTVFVVSDNYFSIARVYRSTAKHRSYAGSKHFVSIYGHMHGNPHELPHFETLEELSSKMMAMAGGNPITVTYRV